MRKVDELLELTRVRDAYESTVKMILKMQVEITPGMGIFADVVEAFFEEHFGFDVFKEEYARVYLNEFSEDEICDLIKFYRSAVGQRLMGLGPRFVQLGTDIAKRGFAEKRDKLVKMLTDRMRAVSAGVADGSGPN